MCSRSVECGGEKVNMSDNNEIRSEHMDSKSENPCMEEDGASDKVQFFLRSQRERVRRRAPYHMKNVLTHI